MQRDFGRASLGACAAAIASGAVMTSPALAALSAYDVSGKGILEATMARAGGHTCYIFSAATPHRTS